MAVVFCEPPPRRASWREDLLEVTTRPGEWALIRVFSKRNSAHHALRRARKIAPLSPDAWSFEVHQVQENEPEWGVWAKWEPES